MIDVSRREAFVLACLRHLDEVVVWGGLDCSELVALGELAVGLPDRRGSHNAQRYANNNPDPVEVPEPGDLGFFGSSWGKVIHVVICSFGRQALSADGATRLITDRSVAERNPAARVRLHSSVDYYRAAPFLGWKGHYELDERAG